MAAASSEAGTICSPAVTAVRLPSWYCLRQRSNWLLHHVAGQRCKVNFAVNTLGFSRRFHVFAAPKQDAEHTYESLVRAFRYFGGCVKTVLVDNQKAAVLKNNNGKVVFNSGFLLLADHNQRAS